MKDELVEVKIKQYLGLRAKTCSYLIDDGRKDKKGTKLFTGIST